MNRLKTWFVPAGLGVGAVVVSSTLGAPLARAAVLDGKQIFLDQKCNMCHAVSSASIQPTGKIKASDLAGLAAKQDAAWLGKYLRKQADKSDKKHIKPFTGSDEELGVLISWLQKQTKAEKK